jgi:hypothetical protein
VDGLGLRDDERKEFRSRLRNMPEVEFIHFARTCADAADLNGSSTSAAIPRSEAEQDFLDCKAEWRRRHPKA